MPNVSQLPRFCDPHRRRFGRLVSARYVVDGEGFCLACFSGEEPQGTAETHEHHALFRGRRPSRESRQHPAHTSTHFTREGLLMLLAEAKASRERDGCSFW